MCSEYSERDVEALKMGKNLENGGRYSGDGNLEDKI